MEVQNFVHDLFLDHVIISLYILDSDKVGFHYNHDSHGIFDSYILPQDLDTLHAKLIMSLPESLEYSNSEITKILR